MTDESRNERRARFLRDITATMKHQRDRVDEALESLAAHHGKELANKVRDVIKSAVFIESLIVTIIQLHHSLPDEGAWLVPPIESMMLVYSNIVRNLLGHAVITSDIPAERVEAAYLAAGDFVYQYVHDTMKAFMLSEARA